MNDKLNTGAFVMEAQETLKSGELFWYGGKSISPNQAICQMLNQWSYTEIYPIIGNIIKGNALGAQSNYLERLFDDTVKDMVEELINE